MFVTTNRVLVIGVTMDKQDDQKIARLRIKNGDTFFTAFLSKKLPPLPLTIKEGSQIDISGFIKATMNEKYGLQYSLTATAVVERSHDTGKAKSTTTEPGEPIDEAPSK